ncbi:hypothetical protein [Chryseobacterium indologenes]|uniref:hypothetical protein n=1 Tax=Chryseobacterium indologenes TaxID=253 RepID=UPI001E2F320C|nr:hypothetical protein [Chryseobacterium indologenes]
MKKILLFLNLLITQAVYSQSDCISAIPICGNSDISYNPAGHGDVIEILKQNGGCLNSNENLSVWYTFTAATSGTLAFTIKPNQQSDDYDFAVYGPTTNGCTGLMQDPAQNIFKQPIRCNFSGASGDTGLDINMAPPAVFPTFPPNNTADMNNGTK